MGSAQAKRAPHRHPLPWTCGCASEEPAPSGRASLGSQGPRLMRVQVPRVARLNGARIRWGGDARYLPVRVGVLEDTRQMALPMSAKEQLRQALELGHEPFLDRRTFPDYPEAPPKIRLRCSCGYESTWKRSEKAAMGSLVWHLGKVLGEADTRSAEMRRNGVGLRQNPAS